MAKSNPARLGRGLAALLGDADATPEAATTGEIRAIPTANLEPGPFQPRRAIHPDAMAELVASIKAQGVLQPLLARQHPTIANRYQIIAGERRWRAAQQAGIHELPVLIRDLPDSDAATAALVENLQREDLNPIEEAEGLRRLMQEFGLSQEEAATAIGKSRSYVANAVRLLNLPDRVRDDVIAGRLSAGHARALLTHADPERAAAEVIARGLNVRQTEALVAARPPATAQEKAQSKDPETIALEQDLSAKLGLRVTIAFDGKGGVVTIRYTSLEQLDSVISLLSQAG